jgi:hypothetical protein
VGSCDANLFCLNGTLCVDGAGYEGGACLPSGRCHPGNRCNAGLDVCVNCEAGTAGCSCTDAGTCGAGLACSAMLCVAESELPPSSPLCYTPCERSLTTGGTLRDCDSDGLMDGCLSGRSCTSGSCLLPGEAVPTCTSDSACPAHQTCKLGRCYSDCETNLDCPSGMGCSMRVCRVPCQSLTGADPCPGGQTCAAADGENGYCVANSPSTGAADAPLSETAGFDVDRGSVSFTNLRTTAVMTVTPHGTSGVEHPFVIRRLSHSVTDRSGRETTVVAATDPATGAPLACDATESVGAPATVVES